jgi:iron(III) transport system permease protein
MSAGRAAKPGTLAAWLLLAVLVVLVVGPLAMLLRASIAPPNTLPLETARVTLQHFITIFASPETVKLVTNTLLYALGSVSIGVAVATLLAWLTERTDMPLQTTVRVLMFSWMALPPLVLGFGWILLINPGNGALNVMARNLFGVQGALFTIYSFWSLILITALSVVPTAYVMIMGLLRNMDPQLETAASVHGASGLTVARRVTLPLLTPGLISVGIYMIMMVVQAFDLPLVIGLTARIPVMSTRVYLLSLPDNGLPNYGLSSAFGVVLLAAAALLMWLYFRTVQAGEKFRTVSGRGFRPRRVKLGRFRHAALLAPALYIVIMALPVAILVWTSFFPFYRLPSLDALPQASLANFSRVLASGMVQRALGNTVLLVAASATGVMLLGSLIAWISVRNPGRLSRLLEALSFAPTAVPPIVMVMAILVLYIRTPLYGTVALLVLSHLTIYLAFATRTMSSALLQLHKELGDAALVCGASWWTTLRRVILPLVRPQLANGWLWVAAHSARDLTIPLALMTSANVVVASALWLMWDFPDLPGAAAVATLLVAALLLVVVPVQLLLSRGDTAR